ncbi:MAG TPA: hypothetical protein DIS66_06660 [Candidatus Omnitrophica bacterium]|nr:hypothetical protein [Candidatus Omnitrophota bacterium]
MKKSGAFFVFSVLCLCFKGGIIFSIDLLPLYSYTKNMKSFLKSIQIVFLFGIGVLFLSGCLRSPARHQFGDYSNAEKYYAEGKYEKAIESYQNYMDKNEEGNLSIIAKYYTAKSYVALQKNDQAKKYYQEIINQYPDLIWAELSKEQLKNLAG